ncbi:DUF3500 domain-containing protein [Hufsiella ginkgonis]|uniref:DUF3500 domain-containing protein n=1 Tax=Hufsiella ginkgonis TaxID=2695274 RepID=A0A7K1XXV0_9SPHI|nr:DUF3500 domain-containing protein [Hufsiella ginkgonis]MXV15820.1 DUF3500 domain-containing protein [Hufsiella ginkgonis]
MKYSGLFYLGIILPLSVAGIRELTADKLAHDPLPRFSSGHPAASNISSIVKLADAFKATLSDDQRALLQLEYSKSNAVRWSNFPQMAARPNRVGLTLGSLNTVQMTAFKALMAEAMDAQTVNEGLSELEGVRVADDTIARHTGQSRSFGSGIYFIAFLGTPSTSGLWELQYGGHHFAFADTYNNGELVGATPSFRGVEPIVPMTANGKVYQPMKQEQDAFIAVLNSLSEGQKTAAKLSGTFNDILLGPGADGRFPNTPQGLKISELNAGQQQLILKAIETYVGDLDKDTKAAYMNRYKTDLPGTYLAFSGSGSMEQISDYIRLDGPRLWLEYNTQVSRDFRGATHPHSVWRDKKTDYGGN